MMDGNKPLSFLVALLIVTVLVQRGIGSDGEHYFQGGGANMPRSLNLVTDAVAYKIDSSVIGNIGLGSNGVDARHGGAGE